MKVLIGSNAYEVEPTTSVEALKVLVENREFVPADQLRLVKGDTLMEGGTLAGNGVEEDDEITMALSVPAGMRKKWRKKRMRRLRRKRRKMRQRAR